VTSPRSRKTDLLQVLGLAQRTGALVQGTEAVRRALRAGQVGLVLTATDAAPGQLGKIEGLVRERGVPRLEPATRQELGAAVGAPPLSAVGVVSEAWATRLQRGRDASAATE
jgi:ribosomal protein L7Ae-like RNA K-turn-binding protein